MTETLSVVYIHGCWKLTSDVMFGRIKFYMFLFVVFNIYVIVIALLPMSAQKDLGDAIAGELAEICKIINIHL